VILVTLAMWAVCRMIFFTLPRAIGRIGYRGGSHVGEWFAGMAILCVVSMVAQWIALLAGPSGA
jgi:hypothetical protein